MYNSLYNTLATLIFENNMTADATLVCTAISACAVCALLAIPFVLLFKFIRSWF